MKAKRGRYRLSPNEEAQLVKDETERRRKQRIIQVREQSKHNATKIRHAVKEEKDRQLQKLAVEIQNQLEKEKEEKLRKLEEQYENSLKSIGQGHKEAGEQYDRAEEKELLQKEDNRRADARGSAAMEKLKRDKLFREFEETKQIKARLAALEEEKERAARIAALPPPAPDPLLNLNIPNKKPVKMTDIDNFTTTHYHIIEQYSIDKANPLIQEDARAAAEEEERRIREKSQELVRLSNDRMARARVRHNNALEKEILSHDYDKMMMDLSDLQRADRERRLNVVASIPKQVFEPPHRRMEDREDHQRNLETAFEDMYMAQTNYIGDLSLALDPHPPPETPSMTESLDVSTVVDGTLLQEPTLPRVPPVLKDMTNIPRAAGEKSPVKKPEKVLKKLMDKIKSQRDEWISKSNGDLNIPDDTTSKEVEADLRRHVPDEIPTRLSATADRSVDAVLEQQKEIENQKRVLEEKLKALEAEQAASRQLVDSKPLLTNVPYQPQSRITNGYPTFSEQQQMSTAYSWSLPQQFSQPSFSSAAMATQPNLTSVGSQYFSERPVERIDMRVPEQNYPTPVPLLPREPVVSSLPKQYVPLSYRQQPEVLRHVPLEVTHKQQVDIQPQRPPEFANQIYPPKYASALSQIQSQRDSGSYGFMQPTSQSYLPPNMPPVSALGRVPTSSLSMSSLSSSSTEYYPQTFPAPSLPVPSTVGLMPTMYAPQHDQTKKIKDYQQYLLERHEQSKKVLADTRAEIERRRQELLQRFPQLASKSPESMETVSQLVSTTPVESSQEMHSAAGDIPPKIQPPVSQKGETTELSPSKAAISSLVSKLASDPYYALRLGIGQQEEEKKADPSKKFKDVRKSLPFDESLQESPLGQIHDSGGKLRKSHFDSTLDSDDGRRDLDDTVMSSSTDRGSPKLNGRKSGQMTDSDLDTSGQSAGRDQNEIYDRRQQELKKQLEEIQKQKEAILQRHDMAHLRLHAEQERLRYQMAEEEKQRRLTPDVTSEDSTTEIDTDEERGGDVLTTKHLRVPPQKQKLTLLSDHRPHELSTIQEVDTPRSAVRSVESARPSLSSSGSSVSRRSLDPYQLSTGTIPEEREPAQEYATPTNRRTAADSGYQTKQIEEILQRAREFDPSVVERLKRQTNDIFASVATPPQKGGTPGSNMSLSMGSLTPDSLSTGPISDSNVSTQYNSPSEAPAFKVVSQKGKNSSRSDSSYPSGMSWADELSNYSGQYHSMKMDDSSKTSADSKVESGFKVLKSSSQEKLDEDDRRPSKSPVDRKYDVFHMKTEQPSIRKSPVDSQRFKVLDDSTTSEGSSQLNLQDLSAYTPSERSQGAPELSQYPLLSKSNTALEKSSSDDRSKGYSSSSAINESSARESPLGGTDTDNGDDNHLMKTAESLGSTATSASSYMDLDAVNGMNRPFDFIGQFKFSGRDQTASTSNSDLIELDSSKYSQKGCFTSTPYTTQDKLSEYALSPEESRIRSGTKQTFDSSSKYTPVFVSKSGDFRSSDSSAPSSGDKKIGATLSQYSIKSDTQGVTLIGKDLSQYSLESPLSQYSIETTENASPIKGGKSLSQYSLKDDSSLSQHSLDPSRQISGISLPKGDKSMTQYSYSDDFTGETPQSTSHDHVDGPHSQYSLHSSQTSMTQGRLNESDIGVDLSSAPLDGTSISQHTLNSTNDEDQNMIDKKFANLDNLIKESRDLIAKHKQLITKNKEWDQKSEESTPERISQNRNANNKNLFEMAGQRLKPEMVISARTTSETSGSSFNVTDDVSPMMITASSADMTQDHLRTGDSLSMDVSSGIKIPGDSAMSRLSQLDTTAGISDEPDLTLVTESSDVSMNQEGQPTHHSEGASSNNNDSVWSFEQHEQSAMSSPDITENDFPDLPQDKDEEEDHSGLAGQTLQESFQRRQQSMSTVKRDAGEDVVFRAVPVVVSPTLSFSMKFNSNDLKPKAPLTWASELKSEKGPEKVSTTVETKQHFKAPELKKETKKETVSKTVDKPAAVVHKSKSTGNLNPALQPRSAESVSSAPSTGQKSATLGHSKSTGIISLGEFLKRQLSNEEEQPRPDTVVQNKNSAIVTTKHKPGPSINTKNVSPSKSTPSFYGKAKEADTTKTPSFSVGKKTGLGTSFNSKPGNSGKPAPSSHMSKTLSSWKKSRAVKSAGPPPPPKPSSEFPNGMKEFPKPVDRAGDDEAYARHMRAYNPRLFRLQNRLGIEEPEETSNEEKKKSPKSRETLEEKQKRAAANRDKVKEFQKKLQENIKKKQMQKKQES